MFTLLGKIQRQLEKRLEEMNRRNRLLAVERRKRIEERDRRRRLEEVVRRYGGELRLEIHEGVELTKVRGETSVFFPFYLKFYGYARYKPLYHLVDYKWLCVYRDPLARYEGKSTPGRYYPLQPISSAEISRLARERISELQDLFPNAYFNLDAVDDWERQHNIGRQEDVA